MLSGGLKNSNRFGNLQTMYIIKNTNKIYKTCLNNTVRIADTKILSLFLNFDIMLLIMLPKFFICLPKIYPMQIVIINKEGNIILPECLNISNIFGNLLEMDIIRIISVINIKPITGART